MNLLYISNEYPPETGYGGIGTYTKHCAEGMAARGHRVHVLCRSRTGETKTITEAGVIVHRIPAGAYPLPSHRMFYPLRWLCYRAIPESLVRLAWAKIVYETYANELSKQEHIDIIEYPECGGEGYYFSNAICIVKIVRLHTPWEMVRKLDRLPHHPIDRMVLSHLERHAARSATHVTSPTQSLADILKRQWNLSKPFVIPNPIPSSAYQLTEGRDLLFLGRVEHRKGVHILIEAYSRLCRHITPPLLRLVGAPYGKLPNGTDYGDFISNLILKVPSQGKVEWIQGVPSSFVSNYLRQSSIAIFPSLWENFSYACLEAMASGLAVIASDCGGFSELIVQGKTGLLVEARNTDALTETLKKLISQPLYAKSIGIQARCIVGKRYDSTIVCEKTEQMYGDFLEKADA
jgi:glycogen synthase